MNTAVAAAQRQIDIWLEKHPNAKTVSPYIQRALDLIKRHHKATFDRNVNNTDVDGLDESLSLYEKHRDVELQVADYMHHVADVLNEPELHARAERHSRCRRSAVYGRKPDGRLIIAWDYKCGSVRLCPDESREDQRRLTNSHLPSLVEFAAHPLDRIFYSVLTWHNYRPGDLLRGKRELFDKFKVLMKQFPNIKGALVIQEDPLSAHDDWNVHLNVFFLVRGEFSYKKLRAAWGGNLHLQQIKGNAGALTSALLEAIKYSAQIVPVKSENKKNDRKRNRLSTDRDQGNATAPPKNVPAGSNDRAPAMTEWPPERFLEWYDAQSTPHTDKNGKSKRSAFRRVRAYGCLYALHGKRWNAMTIDKRVELCLTANITSWFARFEWQNIGPAHQKKEREAIKVKLRNAMVSGEAMDTSKIQWLGTISFLPGVGYRVDLITEDNFSSDHRKTDNSKRKHDPGGMIH